MLPLQGSEILWVVFRFSEVVLVLSLCRFSNHNSTSLLVLTTSVVFGGVKPVRWSNLKYFYCTKQTTQHGNSDDFTRNREPKHDRCRNQSLVGKLRFECSSCFNVDHWQLISVACSEEITDSSIAVLGFTVWPGDVRSGRWHTRTATFHRTRINNIVFPIPKASTRIRGSLRHIRLLFMWNFSLYSHRSRCRQIDCRWKVLILSKYCHNSSRKTPPRHYLDNPFYFNKRVFLAEKYFSDFTWSYNMCLPLYLNCLSC